MQQATCRGLWGSSIKAGAQACDAPSEVQPVEAPSAWSLALPRMQLNGPATACNARYAPVASFVASVGSVGSVSG
jgi:hypothetical protein